MRPKSSSTISTQSRKVMSPQCHNMSSMLNPSKFQTSNILSKCARYYISMYFSTSYVDEALMGVSLIVTDITSLYLPCFCLQWLFSLLFQFPREAENYILIPAGMRVKCGKIFHFNFIPKKQDFRP